MLNTHLPYTTYPKTPTPAPAECYVPAEHQGPKQAAVVDHPAISAHHYIEQSGVADGDLLVLQQFRPFFTGTLRCLLRRTWLNTHITRSPK
jgi:hypothetical protein